MPILRTTRTLLAQLADGSALTYDERAAFVHVIRSHGSRADAESVLDAFLAMPSARDWLVPILHAHGDAGTAGRLYDAFVRNNQLIDGTPSVVLHCLGHLGHEPAEPVLWHHATASSSDHYAIKDACLGLLELPCRDLGPAIARAISTYEGENIFPELLPSLAVKTGNPLWIPRLIRWGTDHASTDCNGGLILGIAMFGPPARDALLSVLWNPRWEANASATGSRYWARLAAHVQQIGLAELYTAARAQPGPSEHRHALRLVTELLELWFEPLDLTRAARPAESGRDLLAMLFRWSTPHRDDSLRGVARDAFPDPDDPIHDQLHHLERALRARAIHELEVQELMTISGGG